MALVRPGVSVREVDVSYVVNHEQLTMSWKCPDYWVIPPKAETASEGMLMAILFGDAKRFRAVRPHWFKRCNASGKLIWPFQKAYVGVVSLKTNASWAVENGRAGHYKIAWLTEKQYVIERLRDNV